MNNETIECTEAFLALARNPTADPGSVFVIFVDNVYVATGSLPRQMQSSTISLRSLRPGRHLLQVFSSDKHPITLLDQVQIYSECRDIFRPFTEPADITGDEDCSASITKQDAPSEPVYLISKIPPLALNPVMPELHGEHRR